MTFTTQQLAGFMIGDLQYIIVFLFAYMQLIKLSLAVRNTHVTKRTRLSPCFFPGTRLPMSWP